MTNVDQFRDSIRSAGLEPPSIIEPGKVHRFATNGKRGDDAGWCKLFEDGCGGMFGDFRTNLTQSWQAKRDKPFTAAERETFRQRCELERKEREAEQLRRHIEAAKIAATILEAATADPASHPYAVNKSLPFGPLVKRGAWPQRKWTDALLVPIYGADGKLWTIEAINVDGDKDFLKGGKKRGGFHPVGKLRGASKVLIGEGIATVAAAVEATKLPAVAAMDCGNLEAAAQAVKEIAPNAEIIFIADNDIKPDGSNPGVEAATAAAIAFGAGVAIPELDGRKCDFWDLWRERGAENVVKAIAAPKVHSNSVGNANNEEWPEPKPIQAALHPVPAFDAETLLPEPLRDWIVDEAERMPCPPDFIAVAAIVALGAIIGARCAIKPKHRDDWLVIPNLWGGVVGPPSALKSPALLAGLRPQDRLVAKAMKAHGEQLEDFESKKSIFEAETQALENELKAAAKSKSKKSNGSNGSALAEVAAKLQSHRRQAPQEPTLRRYKTNDCTVEKLGELLRDNPAGMLVERDELVGLIASWEREGREGERAFFLEAWNGNASFDVDRIKRGHIHIPNLCASILGGIQPDKLTVYLEQAAHALSNDGMLQRFQLLVYPDHRDWEWRDRIPTKDARDRAFEIFEKLADFEPVSWGAAPADNYAKFPHFHFDEEAQAIFIEWSTELHRSKLPAEDHPIIAQHLAKFDKLFPALALILHLTDCVATGQRGPVSKEAALRAAAWCEYLEAHARRCYGLLADDGLRAAQALADKVRQGKLLDKFTARDVRRNQWRYLTTDEAVQAALDWLEDESWLRSDGVGGTGPGTGRRTWRYSINPKAVRPGKPEVEDGELA